MKILVLVGAAVAAIVTVSKVRAQRAGDGVWHEVTAA
ncbi:MULTISPECIES: DLW-39 family protein [Nocardiaceae]|nr:MULTISPECIES: DLW-39 family protein [unclassified Rhodococcus (in: high G+C Gram-positive bacteria)]